MTLETRVRLACAAAIVLGHALFAAVYYLLK